MSDDQNDDDSPTVTLKRSEIRALEKAAAKVDELEAKLATYERTDAFRTAGLDPDNKQHARFMKGYDGDLTPDAIKATALDEGFIAPVADASAASDAEALARMDEAAATGNPTLGNRQVAYEERIAAARSAEEVEQIAREYGRVVQFN